MIKNNLSLNRIANVFYIIRNQIFEYDSKKDSFTKEEKKAKLDKIIKNIDICIDVIDKKVKLKGISKEFVYEAKKIKVKQSKNKSDWASYLNILDWFKN
jgi:hypothetical protein